MTTARAERTRPLRQGLLALLVVPALYLLWHTPRLASPVFHTSGRAAPDDQTVQLAGAPRPAPVAAHPPARAHRTARPNPPHAFNRIPLASPPPVHRTRAKPARPSPPRTIAAPPAVEPPTRPAPAAPAPSPPSPELTLLQPAPQPPEPSPTPALRTQSAAAPPAPAIMPPLEPPSLPDPPVPASIPATPPQ